MASNPTATQAWLRFERESLGLSIRESALTFGTSNSVMQRAERGGRNGPNDTGRPNLLDRVAASAAVQIGSWPAPDHVMVNEVLRWWQQHPLDRLVWCLRKRRSDWQTPLLHVARALMPLPAIVTGDSALDLLLPPTDRNPPAGWTLACPWLDEPCVVLHKYLGVLHLEPPMPLTEPRALRIPGRFGQEQGNGLRIMHPRDLLMTLGWSPGLAAAAQAADLAGAGAVAGVAQPRRQLQRHHSMEIYEEFDCDEMDDELGAGQDVIPRWLVGSEGEEDSTGDPGVTGLDSPAIGPDIGPLGHQHPTGGVLGGDTE